MNKNKERDLMVAMREQGMTEDMIAEKLADLKFKDEHKHDYEMKKQGITELPKGKGANMARIREDEYEAFLTNAEVQYTSDLSDIVYIKVYYTIIDRIGNREINREEYVHQYSEKTGEITPRWKFWTRNLMVWLGWQERDEVFLIDELKYLKYNNEMFYISLSKYNGEMYGLPKFRTPDQFMKKDAQGERPTYFEI